MAQTKVSLDYSTQVLSAKSGDVYTHETKQTTCLHWMESCLSLSLWFLSVDVTVVEESHDKSIAPLYFFSNCHKVVSYCSWSEEMKGATHAIVILCRHNSRFLFNYLVWCAQSYSFVRDDLGLFASGLLDLSIVVNISYWCVVSIQFTLPTVYVSRQNSLPEISTHKKWVVDDSGRFGTEEFPRH